MNKQNFTVAIDAPREKVWEVMWNDQDYPKWTAPFSEGSHAKTDWQEGSKILFLNGEGEGMISRIETKVEPELMVFEHLGIMDKEGKEDFDSEQVKAWAGSKEIYHYRTEKGMTTVEVEMDVDVDEEHKDYFIKTCPRAFGIIKELAEK